MSTSVSDFLTAALAEIRAVRAGDVPSPEDMALALALFNELLDSLNQQGRALYTVGFSTFTLTPALQPHTIGVAGNSPTFTVATSRPMAIHGANLILANNIRTSLRLRDDEWWLNVRARSVVSAVPTDLYYSPDYPNGSLYLWPVPTTAYGIELETATLLAAVALADTFTLPPGYQRMLRLTLAEDLAPAFGQTVNPSTAERARQARMVVFAGNVAAPTGHTRDGGMPGVRGGRFNYLTGGVGR